MNQELLFAQTLEKVRKTALSQGGVITEEQVREAFLDQGLNEDQLSLVYDYLKKKNISIGEPSFDKDSLSEEDRDYLSAYLKEIEEIEFVSDGVKEAMTLSAMAGDLDAKEQLIKQYLAHVADIARLYSGQGVLMEDLIGEGNVALAMSVEMLGTAENAKEAQGLIASMIMEAMENYIAENSQEKETGSKLAGKANDVLEKAEEVAKELGRNVTVSELASFTQLKESVIKEAVRITGNKIDYIDTEE